MYFLNNHISCIGKLVAVQGNQLSTISIKERYWERYKEGCRELDGLPQSAPASTLGTIRDDQVQAHPHSITLCHCLFWPQKSFSNRLLFSSSRVIFTDNSVPPPQSRFTETALTALILFQVMSLDI